MPTCCPEKSARITTLSSPRAHCTFAAIALSALFIVVAARPATIANSDQYIAAHDAEESARYGDAVAAYGKSAETCPDLAGFARVRAAVCRAKGGDAAGAERDLKSAVEHGKDEPWALMARAELALMQHRQGKNAEAAKLLERIFALPITPKWLATYRQAFGDALIALPEKKKSAKGFAVFADMLAEARTRSQRLESAQRLAVAPDIHQRMDAATVYCNAGEWADSSRTLAAADPLLGAARKKYQVQIEYLQARILLGTDADKEKGRAALLAVAKSHSDSEWGRLALVHAARSYYLAGLEPRTRPKKEPVDEAKRRQTCRETAQKLFDLLATQVAGATETGDALWWLANQHTERSELPGEPEAALAEYQRLATVCPGHERAPDALYRAAILLQEKGDVSNARKFLKQVVEKYPDSTYAPGAAFDNGQIALAAKDTAGAAASFKNAIEIGGVGSFYAHRAMQCLSQLQDAKQAVRGAIATPGVAAYLAPISVDLSSAPAPAADSWLDRVRFFAGHGYEEAEWETLVHVPELLNPEHAGPFLRALADAGLAATVRYVIDETHWGMKDDRPLPGTLPVLYPRAYWDFVQSTAQEIGEDPMLLLAIARQESLFQARIESHAGAAGVMQLMPSTATWIAKANPSIGTEHAEDLFRPASSVRVGGYYLRYILEKHDGNAVYAVASYNAGPGNVSKWRNRSGAADLDRFIEDIPFDETRDFVKKVLGNYAAYHSIYPQESRLADAQSGGSQR